MGSRIEAIRQVASDNTTAKVVNLAFLIRQVRDSDEWDLTTVLFAVREMALMSGRDKVAQDILQLALGQYEIATAHEAEQLQADRYCGQEIKVEPLSQTAIDATDEMMETVK